MAWCVQFFNEDGGEGDEGDEGDDERGDEG